MFGCAESVTPSTMPTPVGIQRFAGLWVSDRGDTVQIRAGDSRLGTTAWASIDLQVPTVSLVFRTVSPRADTVWLMGAAGNPQAIWRFVRVGEALHLYPGPPGSPTPMRRVE
jgi:hypothetical protein